MNNLTPFIFPGFVAMYLKITWNFLEGLNNATFSLQNKFVPADSPIVEFKSGIFVNVGTCSARISSSLKQGISHNGPVCQVRWNYRTKQKLWYSQKQSVIRIFLKKLEDISLFVGPLIPLVWTSGDICPGFQSQCGLPRFRVSLPRSFSQKVGWHACLLLVPMIFAIKLFENREQIRLLKGKAADLNWYYSRHKQELKILIPDLLFMPFVKNPSAGKVSFEFSVFISN